MGIIKASEEHW